jgi:hypothetical protein
MQDHRGRNERMKYFVLILLSVSVLTVTTISAVWAVNVKVEAEVDHPSPSRDTAFVGQVQDILDTLAREKVIQEGPLQPDKKFTEVTDMCNEIRLAIRHNQMEKAKALAEKIDKLVDQLETHRYKWTGGSDVPLRLAGNQINHTAAWLSTFSRHAAANDADHEIATSLYHSAYKLKLKVGPFDLFTLVYLNQFCKFLNNNGKTGESLALWETSRPVFGSCTIQHGQGSR